MEAVERAYEYRDWITLLFILCFTLLVIAKSLYPQRFQEFISLLTSGKFISFKGKENRAFHPFNILMLFFQSIVVSIFIYIIYSYYFEMESSPLVTFIRIITAVICFVLIKTGIEKIVANIFELDEKIDYYLFQKFSYRSFISVLLFIGSLLLIYTLRPNTLILSIFGMIMLLGNAIAIFLIYKRYQLQLIQNWFYFILYLCALEIAPYYILFKVITK